MFFRRLIKWLAIALLVLAVAILVFVWPVLGVNPFEGRVKHLSNLTSNEVDFFVRFPAVTVLDRNPLVENLEQQPPFDFLARLKDELAQATLEIAREVNPQIPLGLVRVDLKEDFFGREMALGGVIRSDFKRPRLDNFIFLTRVEFYGRFLSALKRGFVRERVQNGIRIELVNGLYFKLRVSPRLANALRPYRSPRVGAGGDVFYMARIGDVVLFSDNDGWIEAALGRTEMLRTDAWFESGFLKTSRGRDRVEMFVRPALTANLIYQHARPGEGGALTAVRALLPPQVIGELTAHLEARGSNELALDLSDVLATDGFGKLPIHLQELYDGEKGDAPFDLSENGIGRFIPRKRTLAAVILHARPAEAIDVALSLLSADERQLLDDEVRRVSRIRGGNYPSFRKLMQRLTSDLGNTHLIVLHRPAVFEGQRYETYEDESFPPLPNPGLSFTLVSSVKESVRPDEVRDKVLQHLQYIGMKSAGTHQSGKFHLASLVVETGDEVLIRPAYGALSGGKRFFVFSSSVDGAQAVFEAAENVDERFIGTSGIPELGARLRRGATMVVLLSGDVVRRALFDRVRLYAGEEMNLNDRMRRFRGTLAPTLGEQEKDRRVIAFRDDYIESHYSAIRDEYAEMLQWLAPVDAIGLSCALGVGSDKTVKANALIRFGTVEE